MSDELDALQTIIKAGGEASYASMKIFTWELLDDLELSAFIEIVVPNYDAPWFDVDDISYKITDAGRKHVEWITPDDKRDPPY